MAVAFAMQLVQLYLVDDRNNMYANESDLYHTTEMLLRIMSHSRQPPPEGLGSLIEMLRINQDPSAYLGERSPLGPTAHIHSGILQVRVSKHYWISLFGFYQQIDTIPYRTLKVMFASRKGWSDLIFIIHKRFFLPKSTSTKCGAGQQSACKQNYFGNCDASTSLIVP